MESVFSTKNIKSTASSRHGKRELTKTETPLGYILVQTGKTLEVVDICHVLDSDYIRFCGGIIYSMKLVKNDLILWYKETSSTESINLEMKTEDIQKIVETRCSDIAFHRHCLKLLVDKECSKEDTKESIDDFVMHTGIIRKHLEYLRDPDLLFSSIEDKKTTTTNYIKLSPGVPVDLDGYITIIWTPLLKKTEYTQTVDTVTETETSESLFPIDINERIKEMLGDTLGKYE